MKKNADKIFEPGRGKLSSIFEFISFLFTRPGLTLLQRIAAKALQKAGLSKHTAVNYDEWIRTRTDRNELKKEYGSLINSLADKPKISIIIPIITGAEHLKNTIDSISDQLYGNYEICTAAHESIRAQVVDICKTNAKVAGVISTEGCTPLSTYCNEAMALAGGSYFLFIQPGDILAPNCLFEFIRHINSHPGSGIIYADDDVADDSGRFTLPFFKPGWSPDTLLSRNYVGNTFLVNAAIIAGLGGFREGFEGSEYYDLLLRATELTDYAGHIPDVLVHLGKRVLTTGSAPIKALQDATMRRGTPALAGEVPGVPGCYDIQYRLISPGKVSIIIPSKDQAALLKAAIDSILHKTDYPDYEIIVLNNNSITPAFTELMNRYSSQHPGTFRCIEASFPFNFSKLMNMGVAACTGSYILMCNNDLEVIQRDWLARMVSYAQHERTGAVGVKLLYPGNTIQHAGIALGVDGDAKHVFAHEGRDATGYFNSVSAVTNYAALTGACLLCRKQLFTDAGGMDESLAVEYNDLDFCLRLLKKGHYNVYLPVELYHHESATRGHPFRSRKSWKQHEKELAIFSARWREIMDNDPFCSYKIELEDIKYRI